MRPGTSLAAAFAAALLPACFMLTREPPDLAGTWTGELIMEGEGFPASLALSGGEGRFEGPLNAPGIDGAVVVTVRGGRVSLEGSYLAQGCSGTITGSGALESGVGVMRGTLDVLDSCSGAASGTFDIRRTPPAPS